MSTLDSLTRPFPVDRRGALTAAELLAESLAVPPDHPVGADHGPDSPRWDGQSLSSGHAGIAILHGVRARDGYELWARPADWLAAAFREPVAAAGGAGLWHGAPALAFTLHTVALPGSAAPHLERLDAAVAEMVTRQVETARARMAARLRPLPGEFDLVRGMTGLGTYLLRRDPASPQLRAVLTYLVELTRPVPADDAAGPSVPGWWTDHRPEGRSEDDYVGGHSDQGMAHGIAGPLALLAFALRNGITVPGHVEAITSIRDWLERWQ